MSDRLVELKPIRESKHYYEKLEKRIKLAFRDLIYLPIMEFITFPFTLKNSDSDPLYEALKSGRLVYDGKAFQGKFSAETSKALRSLGAQWDRKTKTYRIKKALLPMDIRSVVSAGHLEFEKQLDAIDRGLSQILPEKIADNLVFSDIFDQTLWKVDEEFRKTLKGIIVPPQLTPETRKRIAEEWQTNMRLWIKNFTEEEIVKLRAKVKASAFAGNRYESLIKSIQRSYGVSSRKARFLARQETGLLMAKFKESRYTQSGVYEYRWRCVVGSPLHPVRPSHKALDGKIFRFDDPPITTGPGEPARRNNPGEDYNCFSGEVRVRNFKDARRLYRRRFTGELVFLVTDRSEVLKATPNHPVLTQSGWKSIKDTDIGDYIFHAGQKKMLFTEIDVQNRMPSFEELFRFASIMGEIFSTAGGASQFHGDVSDDKIDVISFDRDLVPERYTFDVQKFTESCLTIADEMLRSVSLSASSNASFKLPTFFNSSSSEVSRLSQFLLFLKTHTTHPEGVSFRPISDLYALIDQTAANHVAADSIFFGQCQLTGPLSILGNYRLLRELQFIWWCGLDAPTDTVAFSAEGLAEIVSAAPKFGGDFSQSHIGVEKACRVAQKGVSKDFSGHVYNLETVGGHYIADNFIVHNCRCTALPLVRFSKE